ncbi:hypothetical protein HMPREF1983_01022 [Gemella bergeri ATCC 700627]|uniref:Uncharacterized protein n=1 Tax=Gemella bergeri ATCC 700627 TaxID=1321820 RepID=U2S4I8_9BACL|nr:hypothetical protein HMPREF1983_01022 [Gemella bergeri ATCC 700627]
MGKVENTVAIKGLVNSDFNILGVIKNLIVNNIMIISDIRLKNNCNRELYVAKRFPSATLPKARPAIGIGILLINFMFFTFTL